MLPDAGAETASEGDLPDGAAREPAGTCTWPATRCCAPVRGRSAGAIAGRATRDEPVGRPSSAALLWEFLELAGGAGLLLPNAEEALALTGEPRLRPRRAPSPSAYRR